MMTDVQAALAQIPLFHDTLFLHFEKLAADYGTENIICVQKQNLGAHLTIGGICD
jgi:hypothetical protein